MVGLFRGEHGRQKPFLNPEGHVSFGPDDEDDPKNWHVARKRCVTAATALISINGNIASSITAVTSSSIAKTFNVSLVAAQLTTTMFLLGYCAGPLIFCPLSEFYGRRWILYLNFLLYIAISCLTAWPPNFGGLLIGRLLAGFFMSACTAIVPAILVDMWEDNARGSAMAIYTGTGWIGPAIGVVISGFLELKKDWRWSMYTSLWLGAFSILILVTISETNRSIILTQRAKRARRRGYHVFAEAETRMPQLRQIYKVSLTRPWVLLFDLISFLCCLYALLIFCLQFMLFSLYPIAFQDIRGWRTGVAQLPVIGQAIGAALAVVIILFDTHRRRKRIALGKPIAPEDRMTLGMFGGVGFPVFMLWFSWSSLYSSVHWMVPTVGGTLLATSLVLIFFANLDYILDAYAEYSASVMAANNLARCAGSAGAPLFSARMFEAMGVGGGGSLIAGMAALLAVVPFLFYVYGQRIRCKSKYAVA